MHGASRGRRMDRQVEEVEMGMVGGLFGVAAILATSGYIAVKIGRFIADGPVDPRHKAGSRDISDAPKPR